MDKGAILITGAGSGLGFALTHVLTQAGYHVFAGVRDISVQYELPDDVEIIQLDVTCASQVMEAAAAIKASGRYVRAIINNAGVYAGGPIEHMPAANIQRVFEVNFMGALNVTRAFLPILREQRGGQIHMVSSLSGLLGLPGDGIYAASKHALEAATESLSLEVTPWDIKVVLLELGAYATNLMKNQPEQDLTVPYQGMVSTPEETGEHPPVIEAAEEILSIIDNVPTRLRYQIGQQAKTVWKFLDRTSQEARRDFIVAASNTENWVKKKL
ncbi:MAG: SDR family NAD(P)-dependent oxidoreductase [Kordiimonas sp.]